jgi:hypothetical protein
MPEADLFGGALTPVGAPRPRPADRSTAGRAEFYQVLPGEWSVVVFDLIPKNGYSHLDFPHHWGAPAESPRWRVARHGELPGDTFLFESREHAEGIVAEAFGGCERIPMGRIEIPSDDWRPKGRARRRSS